MGVRGGILTVSVLGNFCVFVCIYWAALNILHEHSVALSECFPSKLAFWPFSLQLFCQ